MAKGKHAALSANRRAEAAHEVIDRLTTELAEAKFRARTVERRAEMVETMEAEVARLRKLVDANTSDRLLAQQEAADRKLAANDARFDELVSVFVSVMGHVKEIIDELPTSPAVFSGADMDALRDLGVLSEVVTAVGAHHDRAARRNLIRGGRIAADEMDSPQDNRRTEFENLGAAMQRHGMSA